MPGWQSADDESVGGVTHVVRVLIQPRPAVHCTLLSIHSLISFVIFGNMKLMFIYLNLYFGSH